MWLLLLPGTIFPNESTGCIHLLVTTTALFNMSNFIRQKCSLGHSGVRTYISQLGGPEGSCKFEASLGHREFWVLHSDTQVCLLLLLLLLLSSYFWISVQEQGLWEGSGWPPLW